MNAHRMRHFRSALVLLVAGITACLAQQSTSNRGKTTRQIAEPRLENHRLPYEGYGRVTIIDDASMIVQFGGEVIVLDVEPEAMELDAEVEPQTIETPYDKFVIEFDSTDVALVRTGNQEFLDRRGAEMDKRGMSVQSVFRTSFPRPSELSKSNSPPSLLAAYAGPMTATMDRDTGTLRIRVTDTEGSGRAFEATTLLGSSPREFDRETDDGVAAGGSGIPAKLGGGACSGGASSCSITCPRGDNSINCYQSGCKCYCDSSSKPVCECVSKHCDL